MASRPLRALKALRQLLHERGIHALPGARRRGQRLQEAAVVLGGQRQVLEVGI